MKKKTEKMNEVPMIIQCQKLDSMLTKKKKVRDMIFILYACEKQS